MGKGLPARGILAGQAQLQHQRSEGVLVPGAPTASSTDPASKASAPAATRKGHTQRDSSPYWKRGVWLEN